MKTILMVLILIFGCDQKSKENITSSSGPKSEPTKIIDQQKSVCPPETWSATDKKLRQDRINDSTEYLYLNDSLWFTIENDKEYNSESKIAYLKFYQKTGLIEEEGLAIYWQHPIVDFSQHGEWKHYDCNGDLIPVQRN